MLLPLLGSNQDSPDPESGVLPITPRGIDNCLPAVHNRGEGLCLCPCPCLCPAKQSGRRGSNPRPSAWEADALPTELLPRLHDLLPAPPAWVRLDQAGPRPEAAGSCNGAARTTPAFRTREGRTTELLPHPARAPSWCEGPGESHRSDLNRGPLDYESSALPLSYGGDAYGRQGARTTSGAEGIRTPGLCSAIAALSQLSYSPVAEIRRRPAGMGATGLEPVTSTMST